MLHRLGLELDIKKAIPFGMAFLMCKEMITSE